MLETVGVFISELFTNSNHYLNKLYSQTIEFSEFNVDSSLDYYINYLHGYIYDPYMILTNRCWGHILIHMPFNQMQQDIGL